MITLRNHCTAATVGAALLLLTAIAWVPTLYQTAQMGAMSGMGSAMTPAISSSSTLTDLVSVLTLAVFLPMWTTMMAAMTLPSTTPMALVFDRVSRSNAGNISPMLKMLPAALFVVDYLLVWTSFGLVALLILVEMVLPHEQWLNWGIASPLLLAGVLAAMGHLPGVMA